MGTDEEMMCVVCVSVTEGGIVVMDVFWRRFCDNMICGRVIYLSCVGQGCDEEVSLQRY